MMRTPDEIISTIATNAAIENGLLTLDEDGLAMATDEGRELVKTHLEVCGFCREICERIRAEAESNPAEALPPELLDEVELAGIVVGVTIIQAPPKLVELNLHIGLIDPRFSVTFGYPVDFTKPCETGDETDG